MYLGHMAQGKKITKLHAGQKQKTMPSSEWIIVPNTHEAIIEQELFDAVQAILKAKHEEYHSRLGKYAHFDIENIFEGLVACACCQHNMTRYKSVYNKGRTVAYHFICPRHAMLLDADAPMRAACGKAIWKRPCMRSFDCRWRCSRMRRRSSKGSAGPRRPEAAGRLLTMRSYRCRDD